MTLDNKLRQVTDTIHGSIFLSSLESAMIATPYFFRLHDIYQSSTVYMTYPTNRTKRYEHSLGVMQLASRMLFSAVSNADDPVKIAFFKELKLRFNDVVMADIANVQAANECDSVKRALTLLKLINSGDLEMFDALGLDDSYTLMNRALNELVNEGRIKDYHLILNKGRRKTGIPNHEDQFNEIYLIGSDGSNKTLDDSVSLKLQIRVIEKSIPWIYVYVVPNVPISGAYGDTDGIKCVVQQVFDRLAQSLANELMSKKTLLFGTTIK